jgi:hypothetical protein
VRRPAGATEVFNLGSAGRDRGAKPFPLWGLAALSYLEPVAVGVLELRDVDPAKLDHVRDELDAARLQLLDRLGRRVRLGLSR